MACEQKQRTIQQSCQLLPTEVSTEQQSLVLVKKLIAIAVSNITYLRGIFPEKAYGQKLVGELKVFILRDQSCPGAQQVVKWLHGCFDALQKRYLRKIFLSIYRDPNSPQIVSEKYKFKITYTSQGPQMNFESQNGESMTRVPCDNVQKTSMLLVRKLYVLMQNLDPLPDDSFLNMKLFFYDEVTPQEYQPPGFKDFESSAVIFQQETFKLGIGNVITPYHSLMLNVTTAKNRSEQDSIANENVINDAGIEHTEIQEDSNEHQRRSKGTSNNSTKETFANVQHTQLESLVRMTTDLKVVNRRNRSRRSLAHQVSLLEFPLSQDSQPSAPKKRKFSVPIRQ